MKLNNMEKYIFTRELETVLSSGIGIDEGLSLMEENASESNLRQIAKMIKDMYYEQGSFSYAIKECKAFDAYMEKMVEAGELNGQLDVVMKELSSFYEREDILQSRIKEATTYPLVLLCMMCLIVGILVFKVLPIFEKVMYNMGASFHASSLFMVSFGKGFAFVCFVVLLLVLIVSIFLKLSKNEHLKNKLFSEFFLTKKMVLNVSLAKLTYVLSLFVSSGYPLEDIMKSLPDFIDHPKLKEKMNGVIQDVEQGKDFMDSIIEHKIYPSMYISMISIGMKSGKQEDVFKKLVELFEREVMDSTSKFLNVIEPTIVACLSLIVGIILLSIMFPLMGIMATLG